MEESGLRLDLHANWMTGSIDWPRDHESQRERAAVWSDRRFVLDLHAITAY